MARWVLGCALAGMLTGCSSEPPTTRAATTLDLASCTPVDASACQQPIPSYASDVAPVLNRECNACHVAGGAAWPFTDYQDLYDWSYAVFNALEQCTMPPADAGAMPSADRAMLLDWFACGAPNN